MATVEITEKLVGIWFLPLVNDSDWLASLTEIKPDEEYELKYRFRYYKDDKVYDSNDEKSHYAGTVHGTRSYVLASIREVAKRMREGAGAEEVDEILMHDNDTTRFMRELQDKHWAFMRIEPRIR